MGSKRTRSQWALCHCSRRRSRSCFYLQSRLCAGVSPVALAAAAATILFVRDSLPVSCSCAFVQRARACFCTVARPYRIPPSDCEFGEQPQDLSTHTDAAAATMAEPRRSPSCPRDMHKNERAEHKSENKSSIVRSYISGQTKCSFRMSDYRARSLTLIVAN